MEVIFTTTQPTIIDRIKGYFAMKRYTRQYRKDKAARDIAIAQMMAEKRENNLILAPRE